VDTFVIYAEKSATLDTSGSTRTALAITNTSVETATVELTFRGFDDPGTLSSARVEIPPDGQFAAFIDELEEFQSVFKSAFRGSLQISSSAPVSVTGLRTRYNDRGDLLITATPPLIETVSLNRPLFLPHIVGYTGYTTEIILFGRGSEPVSGSVRLFAQSGQPLDLSFIQR
jgi:hypothetical protein